MVLPSNFTEPLVLANFGVSGTRAWNSSVRFRSGIGTVKMPSSWSGSRERSCATVIAIDSALSTSRGTLTPSRSARRAA
ncbi:hypothetical protein [Saccharopolyspora gregorii]|uniref:hypothetical protein n=1 Tax=Saccharopolyspora gregorii TaxID=33914 RepID=UPI0031F16874